MLRFRIFGIPFVVTGYFWVGCVLLGGVGQSLQGQAILRLVVWVACVFVSIVVHEMGHALVGRRFGAQPYVVLHGIGGMTSLPDARFTRPQGIMVSLAGPAAGLALWALITLAQSRLRGPYDLTDPIILAVLMALDFMTYINFVWSLFNLLPILPLDGGQIMRDVLGLRWISAARIIGGVVAALLAVVFLRERQIYLTLMMGYLAFLNFRGDPRSIPGGVSR